MNLLRLNPFTYPYSAAQLRADEPRLSLSAELPDSELASLAELDPPVLVVRVQPSPRPADTRIERYDDTAQLIDGTWQQVWAARAATAEEQAAWDEANRPAPDFAQLRQAIRTENGFSPALLAVFQADPIAASTLGGRLDTFELTGNYALFLQSLQAALAALPAQEAAHVGLEFLALSVRTNMPAPFIQELENLFEELPPAP